MSRHLITGVCLLGCLAAPAWSEWGSLSGRFVYDGPAPAAQRVNVTKDVEFCGKCNPMDESLVVNPDNRGIANVVVALHVAAGQAYPQPHPQYDATARDDVQLSNVGCRFQPHVVLLRTTQTLVIGNQDQVGHSTKIDAVANSPVNIVVPPDSVIRQSFPQEERRPLPVSCSIHPWMSAQLVVKGTPYVAVSDHDGKFTIPNLPVGQWTFQVWHEACNSIAEVILNDVPAKWPRGRFDYQVQEGDNDLGSIKIKPSVLRSQNEPILER